MTILMLIFWIAMAFVCAWVADQKGRNPIAWAAWGFFFGIFALLVLAIVPSLKETDDAS